MKLKTLSLLAGAAMMSGCVSMPEMSRDEYLDLTQETFPGKSKEEVIEAAEWVIRLADPKDVEFFHTPDGFKAGRNYFIYAVFAAGGGTYWYDLNVQDTADGPVAHFSLSLTSSMTGISPVVGANGVTAAGVNTVPGGQGTPVRGTTAYEIFWQRMNHILSDGNTPWITCDAIGRKAKDNGWWGTSEPFCLNAKDLAPDGSLRVTAKYASKERRETKEYYDFGDRTPPMRKPEVETGS